MGGRPYSTPEGDKGWKDHNKATNQVPVDELGIPLSEDPETYVGRTMLNASGVLVDSVTGIPIHQQDRDDRRSD